MMKTLIYREKVSDVQQLRFHVVVERDDPLVEVEQGVQVGGIALGVVVGLVGQTTMLRTVEDVPRSL